MTIHSRGCRSGRRFKPKAVNLVAWLRAYAADEQSALEAVRRAQNAREQAPKSDQSAREVRRK